MASVKTHYQDFLAHYYSWMSGGSEQGVEANRRFFQANGIFPAQSKLALDLGAGSGFQSIPLARSGFEVIAIDFNPDLLKELKRSAGRLSIVTIQDDLLNFCEHTPRKAELIVCMGDTLTHLQTLAEVRRLLADVHRTLETDGRFILSFRDMTQELEALDRFIPVRSDSTNIFTCFLEYEEKHVKVHDIVYAKTGDRWVMEKSCYRKRRISPKWVNGCLTDLGFKIDDLSVDKAMITIIARKTH